MAVTYTEELRQDILERLEIQVVNGTRPRTATDINILEALALLGEIDRLTTCLDISGARLGRVAANHPEAYAAALEGDDE